MDRRLPSSPQYEAPPRVLDALRAPRVRREYGGAQTSPLVDLGHRRADRRTDDGTPTAAHPRTSTISSSADDNSDGQGGLGLLIAADANDRAAVTDLPLPSPRSPTETLVMDFLVAFFWCCGLRPVPSPRLCAGVPPEDEMDSNLGEEFVITAATRLYKMI